MAEKVDRRVRKNQSTASGRSCTTDAEEKYQGNNS